MYSQDILLLFYYVIWMTIIAVVESPKFLIFEQEKGTPFDVEGRGDFRSPPGFFVLSQLVPATATPSRKRQAELKNERYGAAHGPGPSCISFLPFPLPPTLPQRPPQRLARRRRSRLGQLTRLLSS